MDEVLDFSVKKRTGNSDMVKKEPTVVDVTSGSTLSSPQPSSSSSRSSQSPTSTSHNIQPPNPYSMYRAMHWDPAIAGMFGPHPMTPLPGSPSGIAPGFFPPSFIGSSPPDSSMYPTASLALSTLHRRRRSTTSVDSRDQETSAKKSKSVPEDKKDESYWERRRKNNEAAKRSRDSRRAKEEEIAMRAAFLEQENLKLRAQVAILKNETAKLHFMLFNHVQPSSA